MSIYDPFAQLKHGSVAPLFLLTPGRNLFVKSTPLPRQGEFNRGGSCFVVDKELSLLFLKLVQ